MQHFQKQEDFSSVLHCDCTLECFISDLYQMLAKCLDAGKDLNEQNVDFRALLLMFADHEPQGWLQPSVTVYCRLSNKNCRDPGSFECL